MLPGVDARRADGVVAHGKQVQREESSIWPKRAAASAASKRTRLLGHTGDLACLGHWRPLPCSSGGHGGWRWNLGPAAEGQQDGEGWALLEAAQGPHQVWPHPQGRGAAQESIGQCMEASELRSGFS